MTLNGTSAYDALFDTVLSRIDPERAHQLGFRAIRAIGPVSTRRPGSKPGEPVEAMGIVFPNTLGLAAGFDKNGLGIDALAALGFGHIEIGTITGEPQPGNAKPRLFRLPADRAIINRMGFNNDGAEVVARRLAKRLGVTPHRLGVTPHRGSDVVVGVNIGKTKVVPEEHAIADYRKSANLLAPYADYLVVNVSSPNTPGLRDLQAVEKLEPLLSAVRQTADQTTDRRVPLLVKIAPDLSDDDVLAVADLAIAVGLDGVIATNTTIGRAGLETANDEIEAVGAGGLSGPPVGPRSLEVLTLLKQRAGDSLTLISVGGVTTPEDLRVRLEAGATLVQGYTGFIYAGPMWPRKMLARVDHGGDR